MTGYLYLMLYNPDIELLVNRQIKIRCLKPGIMVIYLLVIKYALKINKFLLLKVKDGKALAG